MKKYFVILIINKESFDYDIILTYLRNNVNVDRLSLLPEGILIIMCFDDDSDRRKILSDIIQLDIEDIQIHEILYEEFLPRSFRSE